MTRWSSPPRPNAADEFRAAGLGGDARERFLGPILAGVLGERDLQTSSRYVNLVRRSFTRSDSNLPSRGMGALPGQLAARLDPGTVQCGRPALGVSPGRVRTADGDVPCRAVPQALCAFTPPTPAACVARSTSVGSLQGAALVSGRRAVVAVLNRLGVPALAA